MSTCYTSRSRSGGFDLAVVGAGSAGFSAANTAAEQGARVALIGQGTIGGTCVNVGCVPSKTLIRAAESLHHAQAAARFAGIRGEARLDDWRALLAQKDELVAGLRQAKYVDLLPAYNAIAYMDGPARLAPEGVHVNGEGLRVGKTIVATGASPVRPSTRCTAIEALSLFMYPSSCRAMLGMSIGQMHSSVLEDTSVYRPIEILRPSPIRRWHSFITDLSRSSWHRRGRGCMATLKRPIWLTGGQLWRRRYVRISAGCVGRFPAK